MPKLILPFALLFALISSLAARPVVAAPATPARLHVLVGLSGTPLATDANLQARDRFTAYHRRLDPSLPAARAYLSRLSAYQRQEISYLRGRGIDLSLGRTFDVVWNGFDATLPASQVAKLRTLRNIASIQSMHMYHALDDHSLPLVHAPEAWQTLGGGPNAGRGEMIANIDTGADITNPCFKDTGMAPPPFGRRSDTPENLQYTNNKVVVARAFGSNPTTSYSAQDQQGHGTFSGAIETCDYNTPTPLGTKLSGVAPAAYLMSYNVFPGSDGTTSDSQILAALDAALLDGADVVNMSLGGTAGELRFDVEAGAVSNVIKAGVPVVVSAGNAGPTPQSIASPASDPAAISVGAVSNSRGIFATVSAAGAGVPSALQQIRATQGSHPFSGTIGPAPAVYVGLGRLPKDDPNDVTANDFAGKDLHGKIALIERGITYFETKLDNAEKAGAIGAIIFDNRQEISFGMDTKSATLPAMSIDQASGQALLSYVQSQPDAKISMNAALTTLPTPPDVLSYFSSRGYGQDFAIKPDLVAPGQNIYSAAESTIPSSDVYSPTGFASADGTSFSAPHVTGAVALILQKHPKFTPGQVKAALMETAGLDVYIDQNHTQAPSVMDAGAGMLDIAAALNAPALLDPSSVSFGGVNASTGTIQRDATVSLSDAGSGSGTWQIAVQSLHSGGGVAVTAPSSVSLSGASPASIQLHLAVSPSASSGDYDGYVVLTRGSDTLHVPYFVHVATEPIRSGSVLLVDDSNSRFVNLDPAAPPIAHKDVSAYFERALRAIGKPYTYWSEKTLGPPSLTDLKRASAVIYFTGDNLNGFAAQNSDDQSLIPPLTATDDSVLQEYIDGGGRVLLTGMGAALSDPYFTAVEFGGYASSVSLFDTTTNDKLLKGKVSPPKPSLSFAGGNGLAGKTGLFAGLKKIDISTRGDGAGDNLAVNNTVIGLVGVPGLNFIRGKFDPGINIFGRPTLITTNTNITQGPIDGNYAATDSSDEPTFTHRVTHKGRAILLAFGFEGINSNTGFATRNQVMSRIFQWLYDRPVATITQNAYKAGKRVQLKGGLSRAAGRATLFQWQINGTTLKATAGQTWYRFPHRGTYRVRVEITDLLGHVAVSGWKQVHVA